MQALVEGQHFGLVEGIFERQHRDLVRDGLEVAGRRRADPLGRRIGRHQVGMFGLERLQPAKQLVVGLVGNRRLVEHVVAVIVLVDFAPEPFGLGADFGRRRHRQASSARISVTSLIVSSSWLGL